MKTDHTETGAGGKKFRICQVVAGAGFGGLEYHTVELCNGLADRGHHVTLIAHSEFSKHLMSEVKHVHVDLTGWRANPLLLMNLLRALRHEQPDIVHAQASKAAAMVKTVSPWIAARTIATIHGIKRKTIMYQAFDGVIAVSQTAARQLDHPKIQAIYNGIEPRELAQKPAGYAASTLGSKLMRPLVLAVGRLVSVKGFDLLIQAWCNIDATLIIAGDGPERNRLEQLIAQLNLQDRVVLAGHRNDIPELLADADLLVISSRREGFSYVLAEALHAQKVVVSSDVPAPNEILPRKYIAECENVSALAILISETLADLSAARQEYIKVWEYARNELTIARMIEHTEVFYHEILASSQICGSEG